MQTYHQLLFDGDTQKIMSAIRLWHQSFTELGRLPGYPEALLKHMQSVAGPDTAIVLHGMHPETYRTNYPGMDIGYAAFQYLHGLQFLAAALEAERSGFDAFLASTLPDPALRQARSLVDIPVVSYGEASMHLACQLGERFGVVLFIEGMIPQIQENIQHYGLAARCAGVRFAGFQFADVLSAMNDPADVAKRFAAAARPLIDAGADVLIPGEAPLSLVLRAAKLTHIDGAAVIDPLAILVKTAESLVTLKRTLGMSGSSRGYFNERPDVERIRELASFYGLDRFGSGEL